MTDDWLTHNKKEQELLNMSMKESFRQRDERKKKEQTESEKMQEELEPLPLCPMADD